MSGSISYSQLFGAGSSYGSYGYGSGGGTNLLGTLYGFSGAAGTGSGVNPITALQQAQQNQTKDVALEAQQPQVARDIATFRSAVASAKTPAQLLQNPTVLKVLLTANGLGSQVAYTALAQQALLSNPNDSNSLANTLSDTNWKSTAQTYNFANQGLAVIQNPQVIDTIANGYAETLWRQSLDATTPGLSNALAFRQDAAGGIKDAYQVLGDPVLRSVITTTLGIPQQIAFQPLEAQAKAISSRVNFASFSSQSYIDSFTQRYLVAAQQNATNSASNTTASLTSLAVQAQSLIV